MNEWNKGAILAAVLSLGCLILCGVCLWEHDASETVAWLCAAIANADIAVLKTRRFLGLK